MNEHTGSEPLAVCTAPSRVALINTEASLEAGQQPKFSDMEPVVSGPTNGQKSFNWVFSQADKRGSEAFFFHLLPLLFFSSSPTSYV